MKTQTLAPPETEALADWALFYARLGWPVFAVRGKEPNSKLAPHGFLSASTNPDTIREWWKTVPDAGIGIATGAVSGIAAIDIDPPKPERGKPEDGEDSLAELEHRLGKLPPTVEAITGGGGRHLVFRHPGGELQSRNEIAPNVDLKADGGYIVAEPSLHASGRRYAWEWSSRPGEAELAALPETWERWLRAGDSIERTPGITRERAPGSPDWKTLWGIAKRAKLEDAHRQGRRIRARCPNPLHPDAHPSFDIYTNGKGVPDWVCRTGNGCTREVLLHALGWESWAAFFREFPDGKALEPPPPADADAPANGAAFPIAADIGKSGADGFEGTKPEPFLLTEVGAAVRFIAEHRDRVRYSYATKDWLCWDDKRWARDSRGKVAALAEETVAGIERQAGNASADGKAWRKWVKETASARGIRGLLECAQNKVPILPEDLDAKPWLLNLENGTLDLRNAKLHPHRQSDGITKLAPVAFDPEATCPRWERFLEEVFAGDVALIRFVQTALGYSLTGDTREHCLFFLHGDGRNGKTTFLAIVALLLGDYARNADSETFMARHRQPGGTSEDLLRLAGARFVATVETEENRRLAEGKVKKLSGGDIVTARGMYHPKTTEFRPEFKLWFASNYRPQIRGTDVAIWSRVRLIPFNVSFRGREDKTLPDLLRAELSGILTWALVGCQRWQRDGLPVPKAVAEATADYQTEQDTVGNFLADRCDLGEGYRAKSGELWKAFRAWAADEGLATKNDSGHQYTRQRDFGAELERRGYKAGTAGKEKTRIRSGLRLTAPPELPLPAAEDGDGYGGDDDPF